MTEQNSNRIAPEALRPRISPSELDDPLFRAAAAATVYQPSGEPEPSRKPEPSTEEEPDIPIPPEIWPGL